MENECVSCGWFNLMCTYNGHCNERESHWKLKEEKTTIKDSGERRSFESGAVRDSGSKGRYDLIPPELYFKLYSKYHNLKSIVYREALVKTNQLSLIFEYVETGDIDLLLTAIWDLSRYVYSEDKEPDKNSLGFHEILIPMLNRLSVHYQNGAKKYTARNWEKGINNSSYIDSGIRHLIKFMSGEDDEDHLIATIWNLTGIIFNTKYHPECDDLINITSRVCESNNKI